jgi:hypothetical protein
MVYGKPVLVAALLSIAVPVAAHAQQRVVPTGQQRTAPAAPSMQRPAAPTQQQVEGWIAELRQLHGRLETIQNRAMEDQQLRRDQAALGQEIQAAMERADPALPGLVQRMAVLEREAVQAEQAGEQAKLRQIVQEAQGIQTRFAQVQGRVFSQPEIAGKVQAFQGRLEARMLQVDPQTPTLVRRFQELEGRLNSAMRGTQPR